MQPIGWTVPRLGSGGDTLKTERLDKRAIRGIVFDRTPANILAVVMFIARHADDQAQATCALIATDEPRPKGRQPGLTSRGPR